MKTYALAVVGAGLAGATAAAIAAEAGLETLVLERGRGPHDRRSLVGGWLGRALYTMSRMDAGTLAGNALFAKALDLCREANGGRLELHEAMVSVPEGLPLRPEMVPHYRMSRGCGRVLAQELHRRLVSGKADLLFGTEVERVESEKGRFVLHTRRGRLFSRRCLLATGSHSFGWIRNACAPLGLRLEPPQARLGVRVEVPSRLLRAFLRVMGDLRLVGEGGVLLDDLRVDSQVGDREDGGLLSAFAHTPPGKTSERASFMVGVDFGTDSAEAIRLMKIANILSNDRIRRERAMDFVHGRSVLEHLARFDPVRKALLDLDGMIPSLLCCATAHIPEAKIGGALPTDGNMRTVFSGLYGAGECVSGMDGLLDAMVSAMVSVRSVMEDENG
jgi:hypothetical protein